MPLTPAEVHNVAFKKPPIGKRGYDEEEVDAFLDIVEVELSRLIEENNDLKARGGVGDNSPQVSPQVVHSGVNPAELDAARADNSRLQARIGELESALSQGNEGAAQQLVTVQKQLAQAEQQLTDTRSQLQRAQATAQQAQQAAQAAQAQAAQAAQGAKAEQGSPTQDHHVQAATMLALAQQTADTHMAQSKAEADRLVSEAQANANNAVSTAQAQAQQHVGEAHQRADQLDRESNARAIKILQDAEQRAATITAQFEQRKDALERRVEQLRTFEREYRTRLKSYLESQLRDLDASGRAEPAAAPPVQEPHPANNSQG
jgi:DivIVA domain-containing protein